MSSGESAPATLITDQINFVEDLMRRFKFNHHESRVLRDVMVSLQGVRVTEHEQLAPPSLQPADGIRWKIKRLAEIVQELFSRKHGLTQQRRYLLKFNLVKIVAEMDTDVGSKGHLVGSNGSATLRAVSMSNGNGVHPTPHLYEPIGAAEDDDGDDD